MDEAVRHSSLPAGCVEGDLLAGIHSTLGK